MANVANVKGDGLGFTMEGGRLRIWGFGVKAKSLASGAEFCLTPKMPQLTKLYLRLPRFELQVYDNIWNVVGNSHLKAQHPEAFRSLSLPLPVKEPRGGNFRRVRTEHSTGLCQTVAMAIELPRRNPGPHVPGPGGIEFRSKGLRLLMHRM